jgi:hypothetical protein
MKQTILFAAMLAALTSTQAQERISREEGLKYAFVAAANLQQMLGTPIPTDPDVKRPVGVKDGDYGGMVLPESKLSAETFDKAGKEVTPVGQLWMHKLAPMNGGQVVPATRLRMVHLSAEGAEADVPCCALGVAKGAKGELELLIYGKGSEPVTRVRLEAISKPQDSPIDISAERKDDGGLITLRFVGKYEASFMVTDPEA